jgi:hypothetical protein
MSLKYFRYIQETKRPETQTFKKCVHAVVCSCDFGNLILLGLSKKDRVDPKYLEATSSKHAENVRVAKVFVVFEIGVPKARFCFQISLQKLASIRRKFIKV